MGFLRVLMAGTLDGVAFLDEGIVTGDGDTDVVGLQVEAHSTDTGENPIISSAVGWCQLECRVRTGDDGAHLDTTGTVTNTYKTRLSCSRNGRTDSKCVLSPQCFRQGK